MAELATITPEEARLRLLEAFRNGREGTFLEFLQRPCMHLIEQRAEDGKRKLHPLLGVGAVLFVVACATFAFFSFHS
jgi:hypothetical protein